jgi:glycosyltransferase involved in cell wall biosynthesis
MLPWNHAKGLAPRLLEWDVANVRSIGPTYRIAQVAPLYESVPPQLYGGTERVVSHLTEALVDAGHDVTLFASGDSETAARLEAVCPKALRLDPGCHDPLAHHVRMLARVYRRADDFDLIHCHTDYLGLPLAHLVRAPTLVTLHGRLDLPELPAVYAELNDVPLVSISDAQRAPLPDANWAATVYHGLPARDFRFSPRGGDSLLFLGRMSPEKRPDIAIRVACRAGVRLRMAAKVDPTDEAYFDEVVRPLLDDPLVEYLGEVNDAEKCELLADSLALLFPIDWPEPFGLVMIEALACGTPVIARPCGSVPEVLRDGITGLVGNTEDDLVRAVERAASLDRRACRAEFEERFTVDVMLRGYLATYRALIEGPRECLPSVSA